MADYVLSFNEIDLPDHAPLVGNKAAGLIQLLEADVLVPPGFVVTTAAYRAFVEANGLEEEILALSRLVPADDPAALEAAARRIHERCTQAAIPSDVTTAIRSAYHDLIAASDPNSETRPEPSRRVRNPKSIVAVRSSATAEDLHAASFAGQYDTFLNVTGPETLLEKVCACWASLWNDRAIAYRRSHDIDHRDVAMAVIVQAQVPAEVSGVLFTLNPLTGREEEMTVEASWGLGEAVVSGRVTPDHYVINALEGQIPERRIADKRRMIVPDSDGGREAPVPEAQRQVSCLSDAQLLELTELGYRIQEHFGYPLDIEWALADGRFHVLQARPLTRIHFAPDIGEWTSANFREVMPGIVNPLSHSLSFEYDFAHVMENLLRTLWMKRDDTPIRWARMFFGRAYWNVGATKRYTALVPGYKERALDRTVGITPTYEGDGQVTPWTPRTVLRAIPILLSLRYQYATFWRRAQAYNRTFLRQEATVLNGIDPARLTDGELAQWVKFAIHLHWWTNRIALTTALLSAQAQDDFDPMVEGLNRQLEEAGRPERVHIGNLLTGLAEMSTTRPLLELWELARRARADEELVAVIRRASVAEMARWLDGRMADGSHEPPNHPAIQSFWDGLADYLRRYRYMAANDENLALPRWEEDPTFVLTTLKSFVEGKEDEDPRERLAQQRQVRLQEEAKAQRLLSEGAFNRLVPLRRWLFMDQLRLAQRYCWWREETRDVLSRTYYHCRRFLAEQGHRWAQQGVLAEPDDIFWLERDDVLALVDGRLSPEEARTIVARFRRTARCYRNWEPPEAIYPGTHRAEGGGQPTDRRFQGVACSSGVAIGPARIILDPSQADRLHPGEILVTPYTNPGWTPLFSLAAGIVMEEGGLMSHGAVVARECGIPAVLQIDNATQIFKDGQTLRVDGTLGVVEVMNGSGNSQALTA